MKKRRIFISLVVAITILILGGCGMTSQKETLTKEQQDNVVKRIARGYNIQSIEFTTFSKDKKTGTYHLLFTINAEEKYSTGISIRDLERLDNFTDEIGLSPIETFKEFERRSSLSSEDIDINDIKITYLGG
ncbi:hypothetical protein Q7W37_12080 [Streptococcus suis]|nr:hypothetical protein [Streptococcus suis]